MQAEERQGQVREAVGKPAALVSIATLSSRIAGLIRESLFAALFGVSNLTDAYQIAFRIPNLFRDLFAEGALSSAFVPTFAKVRNERGDEAAFRLARTVIGTLLAITGAIALMGILGAAPVVSVIAWSADAAKQAMAVPLTRIMFPFLPLVALAAVVMGVLNSHKRYLAPAYAPAAFNLVTIAGGLALLALSWSPMHAITGWAVLVIVGGLVQVLVQVPSLRAVGFRGAPRVDLAFRDPDLRTVVRRMGPVAVALAGTQAMIIVTTAVASGQEGWVTALPLAFRLIHLPIGLVGVALGTVALAAASRRAAAGDAAGLDDVIRRGLRLNLFLSLPAAAGLAALAEPIVRLIYEHGKFDQADTALVVTGVRWYALGIAFYAGIKVATSSFHARGLMRVPMFASLVGIAVNLAIALLGMGTIGFAALPLATAAGSAVNYGLLRRSDGLLHGKASAPGLGFQGKTLFATALLGGVAWGLGHILLGRGDAMGRGMALAAGLAGVIGVSGCLYLVAAHALKIEEVAVVGQTLRRRRGA